jgi:hypothetical protein
MRPSTTCHGCRLSGPCGVRKASQAWCRPQDNRPNLRAWGTSTIIPGQPWCSAGAINGARRAPHGAKPCSKNILQRPSMWPGIRRPPMRTRTFEAVVRGAAGRLVWLSRPTYGHGLNPLAMLWRHVRPDVTPGELFERGKAWLAAAQACVARYHREPHRILSIIGALPKH